MHQGSEVHDFCPRCKIVTHREAESYNTPRDKVHFTHVVHILFYPRLALISYCSYSILHTYTCRTWLIPTTPLPVSPSMTTEMPSNTAKIVTFLGMALASVTFAGLITLTTSASLPRQPQDALQYVRSQQPTKIVIDVDAGVDDAMAILLALARTRPGYPEVVAITCTHGNTNVTNVVVNVLKTLRVLKMKIPVYAGASGSLLTTPSGDDFYGSDGLGDVADPAPPSLGEAQREHAAVALVRLARAHPGQLGVIALGPLTNLALAQRLDEEFKGNVKQVYWMGGSVEVYAGASGSLLTTPPGDDFYGSDGLGDVADPAPPSLGEAQREHAAVALVRLARAHPGQLGVIALGPLTNLALAQRLDEEFKRNVKQVYWMGGSVEGIGNIKPGIEFNAFIDPEANYIVFNATGPPIITVSWETCLYHEAVSKEWRQLVLGKIRSPVMQFINAIEEHSLQRSKVWSACDLKAMAVLLNPKLATKAVLHNVHPVYQGEARGALLVDYKDSTGEPKNAILVTEINAEKFKLMCIENFSESENNKQV